jgi:hypothetical protein
MTAKAIGGKAFALLLAGALTTAGGSMSTANAQTGENGPVKSQEQITKVPRGDKIGQHDRELLAEAVRKGKPTVTVMIATRQGSAREVESSITKLLGPPPRCPAP